MVKLANPLISTDRLHHVLWAAMQKIGQKEVDSKQLAESSTHRVNLQVNGTIDGQPISESIDSVLSIGKSQTKSSSVNPQIPQMVAWILSKLNAATRNRILDDLPLEFVELGGMPETSKEQVNQAQDLLKELRQTKTVNAKGAVRCEYVVQKHPSVATIRRQELN